MSWAKCCLQSLVARRCQLVRVDPLSRPSMSHGCQLATCECSYRQPWITRPHQWSVCLHCCLPTMLLYCLQARSSTEAVFPDCQHVAEPPLCHLLAQAAPCLWGAGRAAQELCLVNAACLCSQPPACSFATLPTLGLQAWQPVSCMW